MTHKGWKYFLLLLFLSVANFAIADVLEDNWSFCIRKGDNIISYNGDKKFAMHSVMKFPQALYVAHYLADKEISLNQCARWHPFPYRNFHWTGNIYH